MGLVFGPVGYAWYGKLDKWFPGTANLTIVKKLFLDEIVWGPFFTFVIFGILPYAETKDKDFAMKELERKFVPAWLGSASFWIIFQGINFKFLPLKYRVAYFMGLSFVFDTGLAIYRYQY